MGIFPLLILTLGLASGYNLNDNNPKILTKPGLFGWSLVHQDQSLYVGAPLAGQTGKVFQCTGLTDQPTCEELKMKNEKKDDKRDGSWFGGSLAASEDTLYSCAFRYNWTNFDDLESKNNGKFRAGKCYKKDKIEARFEDLVDFTTLYDGRENRKMKYKIPRLKKDWEKGRFEMYSSGDENYLWWDFGVYGASSTVDKYGNLVFGNPLELVGHKIPNTNKKVTHFIGSIGKIEEKEGRKTKMIRPSNEQVELPWIPPKEEQNRCLNRFFGYTVTSGKFFDKHKIV